MKVFLLYTLFALVNGAALNDQVSNVLECIKSRMSGRLLGLPSLDPFVMEHKELNMSVPDVLDMVLILNDVSVVGLSSLEKNDIQFTIIPMSLAYDISVERITVQGYYDIDGIIKKLLPVYGKGSFNIEIENLSTNGKMSLTMKGGQIKLAENVLNFDIGSLTVDINGLLGGGDLSDVINKVINDMVPIFITKYKQLVNDFVNDKIKDLLDVVLSKLKFSDLVDMFIKGRCASPKN